jgi:hypothetical protein
MSQIIFPYRRAQAGDVTVQGWEKVDPETQRLVPVPAPLLDWGLQARMMLHEHVRVDVTALLASTDLPTGTPVVLAVVGRDTATNQSHVLFTCELDTNEPLLDREIRVVLDGARAGGMLTLATRLLLAADLQHPGTGVAHQAGSILWEQRQRIRLQGAGAQFPVSSMSFAGSALPETAPWHLNISGTSLHAAAAGCLLLVVNENNKEVSDAFAKATMNPTSAQRLIVNAAYTDTAVRMLTHALMDESFSPDEEYPEDSLGAACLNLLRSVFGHTQVEEARATLHSDPSLFITQIHAARGLFTRGSY